ncbi:MAG TPA: hypothetical protein VJB35_02755 [Candidatus Nanoarchaeia archaeon]|nr:hypothetical protein [Candidatus Nanoarchaeia archaeon]
MILIILLVLPFCSSAHYVVGIVNDAKDGTIANDHEVVLWNPINGMQDNLTDIIGVNGNSNADNIYMFDCEQLLTPCEIDDELKIKVFDTGGGYLSKNISVIVTGAGFDLANNLTLNSPPIILSLNVDDDLTYPINQIDLFAASTRDVICEAIIEEYDGDSLFNVIAEFFGETSSFYGDSDDNNTHYTNNSCYVNDSYGTENQSQILCGFEVEYYANSENWVCNFTIEDNYSVSSDESNSTFINQLLSIEVNSFFDFGYVNSQAVSNESVMNITNMGNTKINISFLGYAINEGDGFAMNCSDDGNLSIDLLKYNLTASTFGELTFGEFNNYYLNLTGSSAIKNTGLNFRQNDLLNEAVNSTYWRIYVPNGITGDCQGNIVVSATLGEEGG